MKFIVGLILLLVCSIGQAHGYMNQEAYEKTVEDGVVTFFSRSKNRLWTKGETSGNTLKVDSISLDCDNDSILIQAFPAGPTCHAGTTSCFKNEVSDLLYHTLILLKVKKVKLADIEDVLKARKK